MIRWLIQTTVDHPDVAAGRPPAGLLTDEEARQYRGFLSPRRRRDWLLGRWTSKRLIQAHVMANDGFVPPLNYFSIAYEPSGAPYVVSQHPALRGEGENGRLPVALAISHSNGYAFCALAANRSGKTCLGADIELAESRPASFAEEFFSDGEQAHLNAVPASQRELLTTATWSAKEAVLKAMQLGLRVDTRGVECLMPPLRPRHWMPLRVSAHPTFYDQSQAVGPLALWWRVVENRLRPSTCFILTLAAFGTGL
jgi:4'-phosphopantetheinyl transferase